MEELFSILPLCSPLYLGAGLLGVLVAVLVRLRNKLGQALLSVSEGGYGDYELSLLASPLLYSFSSTVGIYISGNLLSLLLVLSLGLLLVMDVLFGVKGGKEISFRKVVIASLLYGFLAPHYSPFTVLLPTLLIFGSKYRESLDVSLSTLIVVGGAGTLRGLSDPSLFLSALPVFVISLIVFSLYYHLEEYLGEEYLKAALGSVLILSCYPALRGLF